MIIAIVIVLVILLDLAVRVMFEGKFWRAVFKDIEAKISKQPKCPGCGGPLEVATMRGQVIMCLDDKVYCTYCLAHGECGCDEPA